MAVRLSGDSAWKDQVHSGRKHGFNIMEIAFTGALIGGPH